MDISKLLPESKFEISHLRNLKKIDDDEFKKISMSILVWLQDKNWPIYREILEIVVERQDILVPEIQTILINEDSIWTINVLEDVFPRLDKKNLRSMESSLRSMLVDPQKSRDIDDEEVIKKVKSILEKNFN
ncbi:DUF5071 domain-containing protein [Enterococcus termitis]|uniref:DUF5071 domain-containing protein n=1 Tax=Enterococcus termitis TaxID=332950 RepID=A0A1E5GCA7_9ENTE|nr:DUF5071 domain-containing protein [Enterococcus termitis]OEG09870.1 hypothetical protein BCR25_10225 [Enterococcus termitis]OJG98376.1 hypothetical protein RV18_GL003277 [Enterococcus termitis]